MKEIKIISLKVENFKGIRYQCLELNGKSANLYGDNASGKTSVYDALTWLLFGKDSKGNAKFNIKPLDQDGNTTAGVMPTVTAVLDIDGTPVTLKKQMREKWEKHRGGQERYAGNTVDYSIDDVPTKENRYKAYISEIITEETFRALTNTYRFCRDMNWKERRTILFDLAVVASDAQLLKNARFETLREKIGTRTVDDFRSMLTKRRKDANSQLNMLPARIDECEKQLDGLPVEFDLEERDRIAGEIVNLQNQRAALNNSESRNALRNDIRAAELKLQELEAENEQHRRSQDVPVADERENLMRSVERLESQSQRTDEQIRQRKKSIEDATARLDDYRAEWKRENSRKYPGGTCPTCGQALPADLERQAEAKFNAEKKATLSRLVADSQYIKEQQESDRKSLAGLEKALSDAKEEIRKLKKQLDFIQEPEQIIIEDLPNYADDRKAQEAHIADLQQQLNDWASHANAEMKRLEDLIHEAQQRKAKLDNTESEVRLRASIEDRIRELEQERHAKAAYIDEIDRLLDLCEQFVQYKVEQVSAAVNHRFDLVSFRLFTESINGNLQDCCDATVDGVPYSDLNNAMQINAGLDCIRALSDFYGIRVPLFVDNAESVTKLYDIDTQVIRLVVSEDDKELRCVI